MLITFVRFNLKKAFFLTMILLRGQHDNSKCFKYFLMILKKI